MISGDLLKTLRPGSHLLSFTFVVLECVLGVKIVKVLHPGNSNVEQSLGTIGLDSNKGTTYVCFLGLATSFVRPYKK